HMAARGNFVEWETKDGETFKGLSPMPRFEQTPGQIWRPMPEHGGDTVDVLTKLGYTREQIDQLAADGVVKVAE
ncbi:MAG: L-carnitine CoA-transferase, partial [Eggerthellaceae bacterium]|nr:L-carnitine CoA-transferase [Eggerthellaceae bacterium]